jgi:protein phosphatase
VISSGRPHLTVTVVSHPGISGKNNEDRYGVSAYRLESHPNLPSLLAVIADGIGGHRAGEVAAEMAVETISKVVAESDASQPVQTLERAIIRAGNWSPPKRSEPAQGDKLPVRAPG